MDPVTGLYIFYAFYDLQSSLCIRFMLCYNLDKVTFFDFNRALALDLTHDDLHNFHHAILPLQTPGAPPDALDLNQSLGMSIHPSRFPDLLAIIRDGQYDRGSQFQIRSILACTSDITLVTHGHLVACHVQVYFHCDVESR